MIVVDTNVISERVRLHPDERVVRWLDQRDQDELYLASPVLAELWLGLFLLPDGKRRQLLGAATMAALGSYFGGRVLTFDDMAAASYANIVSRERKAGRAIGVMDAQIAAIAHAAGASVATRDTAPFVAAGVTTINPWTA